VIGPLPEAAPPTSVKSCEWRQNQTRCTTELQSYRLDVPPNPFRGDQPSDCGVMENLSGTITVGPLNRLTRNANSCSGPVHLMSTQPKSNAVRLNRRCHWSSTRPRNAVQNRLMDGLPKGIPETFQKASRPGECEGTGRQSGKEAPLVRSARGRPDGRGAASHREEVDEERLANEPRLGRTRGASRERPNQAQATACCYTGCDAAGLARSPSRPSVAGTPSQMEALRMSGSARRDNETRMAVHRTNRTG